MFRVPPTPVYEAQIEWGQKAVRHMLDPHHPHPIVENLKREQEEMRTLRAQRAAEMLNSIKKPQPREPKTPQNPSPDAWHILNARDADEYAKLDCGEADGVLRSIKKRLQRGETPTFKEVRARREPKIQSARDKESQKLTERYAELYRISAEERKKEIQEATRIEREMWDSVGPIAALEAQEECEKRDLVEQENQRRSANGMPLICDADADAWYYCRYTADPHWKIVERPSSRWSSCCPLSHRACRLAKLRKPCSRCFWSLVLRKKRSKRSSSGN